MPTFDEVLTENGYHGTGIKQILDAVQVPKGSFYNFFDSKEHFVAAIISHYGKVASNEFNDISKNFAEESAIARIWLSFRDKVIMRVNANTTCACLIGAMSSEIAQSSELCRNAIAQIEADWVAAIAVLFTRAQLQGDVRNDLKAEEIAASFYNSWQGSLLEYQVCGDASIVLTRLSNFIRLLLTVDGQQTLLPIASYAKENQNV